jgi:hypothetical protein
LRRAPAILTRPDVSPQFRPELLFKDARLCYTKTPVFATIKRPSLLHKNVHLCHHKTPVFAAQKRRD